MTVLRQIKNLPFVMCIVSTYALSKRKMIMAYCTRKNISIHEELLEIIITFKEIFCFIFRNAGNLKVEIMVYGPNNAESLFLK